MFLTSRMMRALLVVAALSAACAEDETPPAAVTPPASPTLAVSPALKQLHFSWGLSSGADRYQLMTDADGSGSFAEIGSALGSTATSYDHDIAVHLLDWTRQRFRLDACNSAGCTSSATVGVQDQSAAAVGYFKASDTKPRDLFGESVAVSADGSTLAVGAVGRLSGTGIVFVFARQDGTWMQQGVVRGTENRTGLSFGTAVALSGNGDLLVVGAPLESGASAGVNGDEQETGRSASGAVYVFERSGSVWSRQAYLKASNPDEGDQFGASVAVAVGGDTIAVGAPLEDSGERRINGRPLNNALDAGAAYVFVRKGRSWAQQAYVKASNTDAGDWFGLALALSADGDTLAVGAPLESGASPDIGGDQTSNGLLKAGAVYVFSRVGSDWRNPAYIKASNPGAKDWFGFAVALAGDGRTLAVGAPEEDGIGGGHNTNQHTNGLPSAGAVYAFSLSGRTWTPRAYIKASNPDIQDEFGWALALSDDGSALVVGAPGESSDASGVGGHDANNSKLEAGAVYTFTRATNWAQQAYVKASNPWRRHHFGHGVGLSADGQTLFVGAPDEGGAATGIGGDQGDRTALQAGAAYLY